MAEDRLEVGRIVKAHGIRGEVVVEAVSNRPERFAAGAVLYAGRGEVRPSYALLVGLPAVAGALFGANLQQRLSSRALTLAFSALLVVIGVRLIVL